jgi:hypothetical protein
MVTQRQSRTAPDFAAPADEARIERVKRALEENGIAVQVADTGEDARRLAFDLLPEGAEVFSSSSQTLEEIGFNRELESSSRYTAVRNLLKTMDYATQARDMVKLGAAPEWVAGSVHAVTESGEVLVASASGSQLGPYSAGAEGVVWVVGSQKLVSDHEEGMRRIYQHVLPLEDARALKAYGMHSMVAKVLTFYKERPGRITMIIVRESLGY